MSIDPDENAMAPELSARDLTVVEGRAAGLSHKETGQLIGRSERTARRRAADPVVAEAIRRRSEELAEAALDQLGSLLPDAISALGAALTEDKAADRLRAVSLVITSFLRMRDEVDVDERFRKIEEMAAAQERQPTAGSPPDGWPSALLALVGVGALTAAKIVAEIADVRRFKSKDAFLPGPTIRGGSTSVRTVAVASALRGGPPRCNGQGREHAEARSPGLSTVRASDARVSSVPLASGREVLRKSARPTGPSCRSRPVPRPRPFEQARVKRARIREPSLGAEGGARGRDQEVAAARSRCRGREGAPR